MLAADAFSRQLGRWALLQLRYGRPDLVEIRPNKRAVGDFYVVHSTLGPMIADHGFVEPFSRFPDPDNVHSVHFASNHEGSPTLPSPPGGPDDCCQSSGSSTLANAGGLTPNPLANAGGRHQPAFTFKDYLRWRETPSTPGTPLDITKD